MRFLFVASFCAGILPLILCLNVNDDCDVARSGAKGKCRLLKDCPEVVDDIVNKGLYPTQCGFRGREQIVCCAVPIENKITTTPVPTRISQKSSFKFGFVSWNIGSTVHSEIKFIYFRMSRV